MAFFLEERARLASLHCMKKFFAGLFFLFLALLALADGKYWNADLLVNSARPPFPSSLADVEYLDLNGDGVFDAIKTKTSRGVPML